MNLDIKDSNSFIDLQGKRVYRVYVDFDTTELQDNDNFMLLAKLKSKEGVMVFTRTAPLGALLYGGSIELRFRQTSGEEIENGAQLTMSLVNHRNDEVCGTGNYAFQAGSWNAA